MTTINYTINAQGNRKQFECIKSWLDPQTEEILYGGAKGGGKSFIGCSLILNDAFCYPQTHYFIARKQLNDLRKFTTTSIFEVLNAWNIPQKAYKYNGQDNFFELYNGSKIFLLDCKYLPSDPQYQRFGSMQMTRGWIEEGGEFDYDSYANLKISIGRWKNNIYNLKGKLLITANPSKNFLYKEFYLPNKNHTLEPYRRFIQALPQENKKLPAEYLENLNRTLKSYEKQRLLFGNWEYDDNPNALISYDNILALFTNTHVQEGVKYITADIARLGSDKAVIMVWSGFKIIELYEYDKSLTTELQQAILSLKNRHGIPNHNIIADEDGIGGGVVDNCKIKGFQNNSKAVNGDNYQNLKTQCYYLLAKKINENQIYVSAEISEHTKGLIVQELEQLESWNTDNEGKMRIKPKAEIKQNIGRSPDYSDAMMMRMYFDLNKPIIIKSSNLF